MGAFSPITYQIAAGGGGGTPSSPDGRELVTVAMTINETDENL